MLFGCVHSFSTLDENASYFEFILLTDAYVLHLERLLSSSFLLCLW